MIYYNLIVILSNYYLILTQISYYLLILKNFRTIFLIFFQNVVQNL
jgi:hypothetical protein